MEAHTKDAEVDICLHYNHVIQKKWSPFCRASLKAKL